jgi:hypothetical protein
MRCRYPGLSDPNSRPAKQIKGEGNDLDEKPQPPDKH